MPATLAQISVILPGFDLARTLDGGQAFRWARQEDGSFHGVAYGRALTVRQEGERFFFSCDREAFDAVWRRYFDLDRDYSAVCKAFCADKTMREAVRACPGIRILRQEPWEALCSFIISQNNHIPRIKGIIRRLCETFGTPLGEGDYAFPSPDRLARLDVSALAPLRAGFRAGYILDAARKTASGEIDLNALCNLPLEQARACLQKIRGVGPKVAECALLYGCGRVDAFPVDVWMKRVLAECYSDGLPPCVRGNEGIAQQYLFEWRRNRQ